MSASDPGPPAPAPARTRRWLMPVLVASLAFNLVIVGAALSVRYWPKHGDRGGGHRAADLLPRSFFRDLDEERREELSSVFRAKREEFREERRAQREAAAAFADALEGEPYEAQLARSAVAEHVGRSHRLIDLVATVAEDLTEALTPEERRALAKAIRHRLEEARL